MQEAIPHDMPEPLGKDLDVCMFCDSDHAGEKRTRERKFICVSGEIYLRADKTLRVEVSLRADKFICVQINLFLCGRGTLLC